MKLRAYDIITRAIDEGINYGYNRAFKHGDDLDEDTIKLAIYDAVVNSLCEVIDFGSLEEQND